MKVDDWLDLNKNETSISGYAPRNKRIPAIPFPGKKKKYSGQKTSSYGLPTEKFVSQHKKGRQVDILTAERIVSGVISDKPPTLKDLFEEESRSSLIVPSDAINDRTLMQPASLPDGSSIDDDDTESSSLYDISIGGLQEYDDEEDISYGGLQDNDDENEVSDMYNS